MERNTDVVTRGKDLTGDFSGFKNVDDSQLVGG